MKKFFDAVLRIATFGLWRRKKSATIIGISKVAGCTTLTLDHNPFKDTDSIVIVGDRVQQLHG